jgi:hypothetical protein
METELDYVAVAACGHVRVWMTHRAAQRSMKTLTACLRDGLSVQRMATEEARSRFGSCERCDQDEAKRQAKRGAATLFGGPDG